MQIQKFLNSSPAFAMIFASQHIARQMTTVFKKSQLTYLQAMVLVAIFFEQSGRARPQELAKTLHTSKGNISHSLAHLQAQQLIQYEQLSSDKRGSQVSLTAKGKKLVSEFIKYFDDRQRKTEEQFSVLGTKQMMSNIEKLKQLYN